MANEAIRSFLNPASIAVVGAGERPTSSGGAVLRNLLASGYKGRIVPINPKGGEILGLPAKSSLKDLDEPVDLVTILLKPDSILDVVSEAAQTGHQSILVLPGGFAEAGETGRKRDDELRRVAAEKGLTIGGPNCAGVINLLDPKAPFAATFFADMPRGGGVAMISQSGAIIEEAIAASHALGIPLGAVVSVGNSMHLGVIEYLDHLGREDKCKAILLYLESFGDAARFAQVAREVAKTKPVVALIGGRTVSGREAAFRHTGSRPADELAIEDFCNNNGIVRVKTLRRLLLAGKAFGAFPRGIGRRVLLLSNSGGPGVLAADQATDEGLTLPELPAAMVDKLREFLPPEASVANPLDLLADAREDRFSATLAAALEFGRGDFDAVLIIHVIPFMVDGGAVVDALAALCKGAKVPILHSMMGTLKKKADWFALMEHARVPVFNDSEEMCIAAGALARHRDLNAVR
ncbi:MAG TPA: CoA-binding protein [Burkholderiales bacterium]|nr:CoA-binding protein [Burkholderiales bacterium]